MFYFILKSVVWEVPGVKKGYLMESTDPGEKGLLRLKTDGINLQVWFHLVPLAMHMSLMCTFAQML